MEKKEHKAMAVLWELETVQQDVERLESQSKLLRRATEDVLHGTL